MPRFKANIPEALKANLRIIGAILFGLVVFLLAVQITFVASFRKGVQSRVFRVGTGVSLVYKAVFPKRATLIDERNHYRELSQRLAVNQTETTLLNDKIRELERLIEYRETLEIPSLSAKVLARSTGGEQKILIDKGERQGIAVGMPVVVDNGHMIGYISDVKNETSTVLLLSDKRAATPVSVASRPTTQGIAQGLGGFLFEMNLVPKTETIEEGDIIITSGISDHTPEGLVIGIVDEVISQDSSAFQSANIEPLVDARDHTEVLVLLSLSVD